MSFAYHDIINGGGAAESGFNSPGADSYKLTTQQFKAHLAALDECRHSSPFEVLITFDDGGTGALRAADALERSGRRGYFFIPTAFIGTRGFLTAGQISGLHSRGHIIGSHSVHHRGRMSAMPDEKLFAEWAGSVQTLSGMTGAPIDTASVPSGFYGPRVAEAAARFGIRSLFTQQPTTHVTSVSGCDVLGRFTVRSWTSAPHIAALAQGKWAPRFGELFWWRVRWAAKACGGDAYRNLRRIYFERRTPAGSV